jgi:hypothetical protein
MPSSEGITPCKKTQVETFFLPQTDPISAIFTQDASTPIKMEELHLKTEDNTVQ